MNNEKSDHDWLADFNYINYSMASITACSNQALFNVKEFRSHSFVSTGVLQLPVEKLAPFFFFFVVENFFFQIFRG